MSPVLIPGTELTLSRLAFGTARLHRIWSARGRQTILERAFDAGITHFDTSPYYGYGLAEIELGKLLRRHPDRLTVASKFGLYPPKGASPDAGRVAVRKAAGRVVGRLSQPRADWTIESAAQSLERTLRRLGLDALDLLLLHEPDPKTVDESAILAWLESRRREGKIREWGVAGDAGKFEAWLRSKSPLCRVIQALDSFQGHEAALVDRAGHTAHLTYGVLDPAARRPMSPEHVRAAMEAALARNRLGSVIISTGNSDHLKMLVEAAGKGAHGPL